MMTPWSALAGRKIALYRLENNLPETPIKWELLTADGYAVCDRAINYKPENSFHRWMVRCWESEFMLSDCPRKYWAGDVEASTKQALQEINVHRCLLSGRFNADDLGLRYDIFEKVVQGERMLDKIQYAALATALEVKKDEDILFIYYKLLHAFSPGNPPKPLVKKYTFDDFRAGNIPSDYLLSGNLK